MHTAQSKPTRNRAGAISDGEGKGEGEGEGEGKGEGEGEGEDDDDAYGEGDDRGGDRAVHLTEHFDPENPLDFDWSVFKYPVARDFLKRFREADAIAAMFHLCPELARLSGRQVSDTQRPDQRRVAGTLQLIHSCRRDPETTNHR